MYAQHTHTDLRPSSMTCRIRRGALAVALATYGTFAWADATNQDGAVLSLEVQTLRAELQALRDEVRELRKQAVAEATAAPPAKAAAVVQAPAGGASNDAAPMPGGSQQRSPLTLFGYGELGYTRPTRDPSGATANLTRGVLGWGYAFSPDTRMAAELELESGVASSSDAGEIELEQFYVAHDINPGLTLKTGLFLMPAGYLNQSHEPAAYYGVFRNEVETRVIPSTWRELGAGLEGTTESGWRWNAGLVTSPDLGKWDPAAGSECALAPLQCTHQEGSQAKAKGLTVYGALNYDGVLGLNVGGSLYTGDVGQGQAGFAGARYQLGELHARWEPGPWQFQALAAYGRFTGVAAINATLFAGQPTPIPDGFGGAYLQAAYRGWNTGGYRLSPFARYEILNTARGYSGIPQGLTPPDAPTTRVLTSGASLFLTPQVVFKADYQVFRGQRERNALNLGVGFQF